MTFNDPCQSAPTHDKSLGRGTGGGGEEAKTLLPYHFLCLLGRYLTHGAQLFMSPCAP